MKRLLFLLLLVILVPNSGFAQEKPDFQLRFPTHIQILDDDTKKDARLGVALWGILPDVTAEKSRATTLLVGGLLWQHKNNWIELLAGSRMNQNGYIDPILNLRLVNNKIPGLSLFGEIQQSVRQERRRTLYWLSVTTPVHIWNIRAGVETENIHFFGKANSIGIGPEVIVPLPMKLPARAKVSVITTYQIRNDHDLMRIYIVTNFSK